ncbi:MAG TPA: hypothetical protein VEJ63_00145 [Planctomycetota bacterium]|nr:hypothetical protein [Planctomycetota bacterium]
MRTIMLFGLLAASCLLHGAEGGIIEKRVGAGCASNLKQIAVACAMYADAPENGKFPEKLKDLVPTYLATDKILRCLGMKADTPGAYVYVPGGSPAKENDIVAFCPCKGHAEGGCQYVTASGEVKPIAKLAEFRKLVKEQLDARKVDYDVPTALDPKNEKHAWIMAIRRELELPIAEEKKEEKK